MPSLNWKWKTTLFLTLSFVLVWVSLGFYQTHYLSGLRILGDYQTQNVIGTSKDGRADEWSTYLPMLKQAYLEGFPDKSSLAPYQENLDWFIGIPKKDLSLIFLPNQLLYWVLPGGNALSFQGIYYNLLLLFSVIWLLRNLRVKTELAVFSAFLVLFSHFYQVWWTSNFPVLGAGILPFAVLTSNLRARWKFPLLFWSLGHLLFGQIYPPFCIALAAGLLPLIAVTRPELITRKNLFFAALCAAGAFATFLALRWHFILDVSKTTYPGTRISTGGGENPRLFLETILPTFPLGSTGDAIETVHEFSLVGTIIPVLFLSLLPFIKWDRSSVKLTAVTGIVLSIMAWFMVFGFPVWLAKITLFYLVPGRRMVLGFSLLILFYCVMMISRHWKEFRIPSAVVAIFIFSAISYFYKTRIDAGTNFFMISWYWLIPAALAIAGLPFYFIFSNKDTANKMFVGLLLFGMTIFHVIVYGSFNPIMRAKHILTPVDSQLTKDIKYLLAVSGKQSISVTGNYGHLLRGENLPVFNAIHMTNVERSKYTSILGITAAESEEYFNRFRGISFKNIGKLDAIGATVIFPSTVGGVGLNHHIGIAGSVAASMASVPQLVSSEVDGHDYFIVWDAHLIKPIASEQPFNLDIPCTVIDSWLTRYPIQTESNVGIALQGIAGRTKVAAESKEAAERCIKSISISN